MRILAATLCLGFAVGCSQAPAAAPDGNDEPQVEAVATPPTPTPPPTTTLVAPTPSELYEGTDLPCSEADKVADSLADVRLSAPGDGVLFLLDLQSDYYRVARLAQATGKGATSGVRLEAIANDAGDAAADAAMAFTGLVGSVASSDYARRELQQLGDAMEAVTEYCAAARGSSPASSTTSPSASIALRDAADLRSLMAVEPGRPLSTALQANAWQEVAVVQEALNVAGYGDLEVDGHFGPQTASAVRRFQADSSVTVDGVVGRETLRALVVALSDAGGGVPDSPTWTWVPPVMGVGPSAICVDGWVSYSGHRQGTCSHHGGVSVWR